MNHRNALILLGAACIGIAVGVAFFSQETLASASPGDLGILQDKPAEPAAAPSDPERVFSGPNVFLCRAKFAPVMAGRFAGAGASTVVYVVSAEAFPTSCRNIGVAWGSACGRIGAMLAPFAMDELPLPFACVGLAAFAAAVLALRLDETAGKPLRDAPGDAQRSNSRVSRVFA